MNKATALALKVGMAIAILAIGSQGQDSPKNAAIVGLWRGEFDNLPAVVLNVTDEVGPLQGAMLFYLIRREPGKPSSSSPGLPESLFNPHFDGKSLTFQLSHRHAHGNTPSDPPVTFRLDLLGPDEARLVSIPADGAPSVRMARDKNWK